jgi:hypothetical protein
MQIRFLSASALFLLLTLLSVSAHAQEGKQSLRLDNLNYENGGEFVYFPEHDYGFTDQLTVAAWVRWESDPTNTVSNPHEPTQTKWANLVTLDYHDATDAGMFWLQHNIGNTKFEWAVRTNSTRQYITSSTVPVQNRWYFVVGVYDGSPSEGSTTMRFYIDGEQEASLSSGSINGNLKTHNARMRMNIGRIPSDYRLFNGQVDEVRIWKRALSREEIRKQMHSSATVNPLNLASCYSMNVTSGSTVVDSTGNLNGTFYTALVDVHSAGSGLCAAIPFTDFTILPPWQIADADKDWSSHDFSGMPTLTVSGTGVNQSNAVVSNTCNTLTLSKGWAGIGADTIKTPVVDGLAYDTWLGIEDVTQTSQWQTSTIPVASTVTYIRTTTPATVGSAGASMRSTITSTPDSTNNSLTYTYGASTDPPVTGESLPSGITGRSAVVWGSALFGTAAATLVIDYSSVPGIVDPSLITLLRRNPVTGSWTAVPAPGLTHNTSLRTFTLTGVVDSYEYALGANLSLTPLPVELQSFQGHRSGDNVELRWRTATEINSHLFEIDGREHGHDAWLTLASRQAAGQSNVPRSYRWTHVDVPNEVMEYRLRMIDRDGSQTYSKILHVAGGTTSTPLAVTVYPNPADNELTVAMIAAGDSRIAIRLYDMLGREQLQHPDAQYGRGSSLLSLPLSGIRAGMYVLEVSTEDSRFVKVLHVRH